jgi:hypothetical protein
MRMNYALIASITIISTSLLIPLSAAIEDPTVDVEISRIGIDSLRLNLTITNPDQKDIFLKGLNFSISDPIRTSGSEKWKTPLLLKTNESIIHSSKCYITGGDPLKRFYRRGSANITISGSVFIEADSDSSAVPFHKTTTIFPETDGANQAVSPYVTDIKFEISRLVDEEGVVKMIIATTNVLIYNPNPVSFYLPELDCDVIAMQKKNGKLRTWKRLPVGGGSSSNTRLIVPMDTYVYSAEKSVSDNDIIEYFAGKEPRYIKVKGTAFLITKNSGWSPAYFEPAFNTIITINGSGVDEEVAPTAASIPASTTTPEKGALGFKAIYAIVGLFTVAYLLRRRE